MSKRVCWHCVAEVQLFKQCCYLSAGTVLQGWSCLSGVITEQVRWAELEILLYFYFRTDQVKPLGICNCLGVPSFFLLREIYSVRMSTSEFGSIILLNKESLHLISVDLI